MAASVSRNLATTILSSSPQSSNMARTAWRSEFIQPVTVHQNMANVARPVHVNALDMVPSAEDVRNESATPGMTSRTASISICCQSMLPTMIRPNTLTAIQTPAKKANSRPYARPFASRGPLRDTYRSSTRPGSERAHASAPLPIALFNPCIVQLYTSHPQVHGIVLLLLLENPLALDVVSVGRVEDERAVGRDRRRNGHGQRLGNGFYQQEILQPGWHIPPGFITALAHFCSLHAGVPRHVERKYR